METNKGVRESRTIETCALAPESIGFPLAAQAARLLRQHAGRKDEIVALVTSLPAQKLNAQEWLLANRQCWGIENGLHQRLDVSLNDDRCRVRSPHGLWVLGMFRRLANSLFMEWRSHQSHPQYLTSTDFAVDMAAEGHRRALIMVTTIHPSFTRAP